MDPMLQRHCAKFIYIVPDGLRELMSDISREVIRAQPEQIYTFIADYLDALMITRENARIAARLVDCICEIAETTVDILLRIGLSRSQADAIVAVIQTAFREHVDRKKKFDRAHETEGEFDEDHAMTQRILDQLSIADDKLEETAVVIQTAWRKFKDRQKREKNMLFGMVDWRIAARSAIMMYRKTGVSIYEANRAATLIKAAYKGYYTRRIMRRLMEKGLQDESIEGSEREEEESEHSEDDSEMKSIKQYLHKSEAPGETGYDYSDYIDASATPASYTRSKSLRHARSRKSRSRTRSHSPSKSKTVTKSLSKTGSKMRSHTQAHATHAIAAADHESWSPLTEQVTDEGPTLPIDGEAPPEDFHHEIVDKSHPGEGPDDGADMTEQSEGKMPPPNTEDVSSGEGLTSGEVEADELPTAAEASEPESEPVTDNENEAGGEAMPVEPIHDEPIHDEPIPDEPTTEPPTEDEFEEN